MLHTLVKSHPEFKYATIVRSQEGANKVKALLPNVRILMGDLNEYVLARTPAP